MKQFEYKQVIVGGGFLKDEIDLLNPLGAEGWQVISTSEWNQNIRYLLIREVTKTEDEKILFRCVSCDKLKSETCAGWCIDCVPF